MIANIFYMISKKQQLKQEVIEKLIDCIGDSSDVAEKFLGSSNYLNIPIYTLNLIIFNIN